MRIAIAPPLTAPYDEPYKVVSLSGRVLKIQMKGKVEMVTADRVKPAHIEREPETCSTQQRQMQSNNDHVARQRSRSTTTPKSLRTRVNSDKITNTRSSTLGVGIPERKNFLALTGRMGVFERARAYPYICQTTLTIQKY